MAIPIDDAVTQYGFSGKPQLLQDACGFDVRFENMRFQSSQAVTLKGVFHAQVSSLGGEAFSPISSTEPIAELRNATAVTLPRRNSDSTGKTVFNDDRKMFDRFSAEITAYPLARVCLGIWINEGARHPSGYKRVVRNGYKSRFVAGFIRPQHTPRRSNLLKHPQR